MKSLLFTLCVAFVCYNVSDAQVMLGFNTGVASTSMISSKALVKEGGDVGSVKSVDFGFFVRRKINSNLTTQVELNYVNRGFKTSYVDNDISVLNNLSANYLDITTLCHYTFSSESSLFTPTVFCGTSIGVLTDAVLAQNRTDKHSGDSKSINVSSDFSSLTVSTIFGAGVYYNVGTTTFSADVRYNHGLTNIAKATSGSPNITNSTFLVRFGAAIPFKF